jgi:hypothetical protein
MNAGQEQGTIFRYSARAAKGQFGQQWDESQARSWDCGHSLTATAGETSPEVDRQESMGYRKRGLGTLGEGAFPFLMRSRLRQFLPEAGPYLAQKEA